MFWKPAYILLIILSTIVDYFAAILMDKETEKSKRKKFLLLSLATNLGILFLFKYFNFFNFTLARSFNLFGVNLSPLNLDVLLPVGISFYTFQTLSYTIDVYRGITPVERHFGIFALYVSFFPQLVAGPIERSHHLLPQFREVHKFDYQRIRDGLILMLWGFFKKVVIADRLAAFVDIAYRDPSAHSGWIMIYATVFFAFQIYCDFSGYSDIAIGAAKVLGFNLMKNFERPYFSKSIREFWQRWHISLSTWFKDYVYIPLGGSRVKLTRGLINLMLTFTISGLWHGASWTFIIWGMLHGFYLMFERLTMNLKKQLIARFSINPRSVILKLLGVFYTFTLVNIGWVFFRAGSLSNAKAVFASMLHLGTMFESGLVFHQSFYKLGLTQSEFYFAVYSILALLLIEFLQRKMSLLEWIKSRPTLIRWAVYYGLIVIILIFGVYGNYDQTQFIYFTF
jgi:D-alanyl-lipoteichoic acid acyltransferase DltB (MBOAT superfamily)